MSPALTAPSDGHVKSATEMDEERQKQMAYEYLCHLEEAKKWTETVIKEELPEVTELEQNLRNGVVLAKLAVTFAPEIITVKKIFDLDQRRYNDNGLHFRHTDNINYFLQAVKAIGLPEIFTPETTDVYDAKNLPRLIFCIHALSLFLYRLGLAPPMMDLYGKVTFTAEQISAMRQALDAYGLPMPQFRKIGGILADEVPVDEAAFHAAIMAINTALDGTDQSRTLKAMQNPNACLSDIDVDSAKKYHVVLASEKHRKVREANNRPVNYDEEADAYDEMLSQEEIQNHLDKINLLLALERIEHCVRNNDTHSLSFALEARHLHLEAQVKNNMMYKYLKELARRLEGGRNDGLDFLRKEDVEKAIKKVNAEADKVGNRDEVVARVNGALEHRDEHLLMRTLKDPALDIKQHIVNEAAPLYLAELSFIREDCRSDLKYEAVKKVCEFLAPIAKINKAAEARNCSEFWQLSTARGVNLEDLEYNLREKYVEAICAALSVKLRDRNACPLLNHAEIQDTIDLVNDEMKTAKSRDYKRIEAIREVNDAVERNDAPRLRSALFNPDLRLLDELRDPEVVNELKGISDDDTVHLLCLLADVKANRSLAEKEDAELWMDNIVEAVTSGVMHGREAKRAGTALAIVNMAIMQGDAFNTFQTLCHDDLNLTRGLRDEPVHRQRYQDELSALVKKKERYTCPWVVHRIRDGDKVYLNLQEHSYSWRTPGSYTGKSGYISASDIDDILAKIEGEDDLGNLMARFQARARGYLVRQALFTMLEHYYKHEAAVVKVQAIWRGRVVRKKFGDRLKELNRTRLRPLSYFRRHLNYVMLIQRVWRAQRAKKEFRKLLEATNTHKTMDVPTVRRYLHLLDMRPEDFRQELELQNLKADITKMIRLNQDLEKDLDCMDVKIGLLVKNRIDVEDVVAHGRHLNRRIGKRKNPAASETMMSASDKTATRGLKALKKESREKLDAYQHLFYQLQTDPTYLAKLIFIMPQSSSTKFLDSVILTLYNFGANQREEYLLLKLFKTALEEEVRCKVEKLSDIVSGNPLVIKMIVGFYKSGSGQLVLRELLGPLIQKVLDNKDLHINTNPVEIYKQWINSKEVETGKPCGMPYNVTAEEALKYEEVKSRLNASITKLKMVTTMFLATIAKSRAKLPYGILYMAKVLYHALAKKFPGIPEKDVLKVVGNLIYYRYINSAIVAPDAFNIVDVSVESGGLNNEQRRNLGSVAKILQFAATKKGFGDESPHLTVLNPYITECHEKFKKFFLECCQVAEPEDAFNMDQYSEATLLAKPIIYISLQELHDTHVLLLEHLDAIAPDHRDPLRQLLLDLGDSPSICSLLGAAQNNPGDEDASLAHLAKTEVCLTLTNKFALAPETSIADKLFVKTKQLLMTVLPCTTGDNLIGCLKSKTYPDQEDYYWDLIDRREAGNKHAERNANMLDHTNHFKDDEVHLSLDETKRLILKNLQILERHGYVSSKDGCAAIIASLAKDICNQRSYRSRRRREIFRLQKTIRDLETKTRFQESQVDYYDQYLKQCLANLHTVKKRVHFRTPSHKTMLGHKTMKKETLKYSASKLYNKGILLAIDGLPENQFKNVLFEIVPTNTDCVFEIHAKFMGVRMESVDVNVQDLLQLQYEGVSVMNMFDKAKINVNLLLHFLNSKFFGRRK